MEKIRRSLVALPAFLLGCLVTASLAGRAEAKPSPAAPRFVYRTVESASGMTTLGQDGWEYVGESAATDKDGSVDRSFTMRHRE